jgi:hypothetical protein
MELGTLVHPYLGSKSFFHYRCPRDGFLLVALSIVWNGMIGFAVMAWMGYVCVNEAQIKASMPHLSGHYGLFIVYAVKHLQAELTGMVQGDVLFFNAFFYSIIGIAALLAAVVYIVIIIDCAYPESGHLVLKMTIMVTTVIFYGVGVPAFVLQEVDR